MGVLVAAFIVKSVDVSVLQWIVAVVILYSALSIIAGFMKPAKQ